MLDIRYAVAGERACELRRSASQIRLPPASSTRVIRRAGETVPAFAKALYAVVNSSSVTSPVPSASDGTIGRSESMPMRWA
jgi:hypothetical protein